MQEFHWEVLLELILMEENRRGNKADMRREEVWVAMQCFSYGLVTA